MADAPLAGLNKERPGDPGAVVDSGRRAGPQYGTADVVPGRGPPAADLEGAAGPAPRGYDGEPIAGLKAGQPHEIGGEQSPDLLGDRREQLLLGCRPGH